MCCDWSRKVPWPQSTITGHVTGNHLRHGFPASDCRTAAVATGRATSVASSRSCAPEPPASRFRPQSPPRASVAASPTGHCSPDSAPGAPTSCPRSSANGRCSRSAAPSRTSAAPWPAGPTSWPRPPPRRSDLERRARRGQRQGMVALVGLAHAFAVARVLAPCLAAFTGARGGVVHVDGVVGHVVRSGLWWGHELCLPSCGAPIHVEVVSRWSARAGRSSPVVGRLLWVR